MVDRMEDKFASQLEHFNEAEIKKIHEGEKRSKALEIIIASDGERYQWIGKNTRLSRTSRFDDIANGTDIILEFVPEQVKNDKTPIAEVSIEKLALGIDASRNTDIYALQKKLQRNLEKILDKTGKKLPEIKYFQSAVNKNIREKLNAVIPIIIGLESEHVNGLMRTCAASRSLADPKSIQESKDMGIDTTNRRKRLQEQLLKHPAQVVFYREMVAQLNYYLYRLEYEQGFNVESYKTKIKAILKRVEEIKNTKRNILIGSYKNDGVLKTIEEISSQTP